MQALLRADRWWEKSGRQFIDGLFWTGAGVMIEQLIIRFQLRVDHHRDAGSPVPGSGWYVVLALWGLYLVLIVLSELLNTYLMRKRLKGVIPKE